MALIRGRERDFARVVSRLGVANPFLPERTRLEREALGTDWAPGEAVWSARPAAENPNLAQIAVRAERLAAELRSRLVSGVTLDAEEDALYVDLVFYVLYSRHEAALWERVVEPRPGARFPFFRDFAADVARFLEAPGIRRDPDHEPARLFAHAFQIRRAFQHVFWTIVGASMPAARLRAAVWQSIFTHDARRYRRALVDRMADVTTLVTGPSGTGKELVARAIALSRWIPFDSRTERFREDFAESFHALNLSALSPTLVESELFGHRRGAFTGALADRAGWLETCSPLGTIFLDEIGELDAALQVKLLRVLQTRTFQRIGDVETRRFPGKIVAATNRDLGRLLAEGSFREDFYYRLCADRIRTPSLREQLDDAPDDLARLIRTIAARTVPETEAKPLAAEVLAWVETRLGSDYSWPGNVRELEQCVRNVMVRGEYVPESRSAGAAPADALRDALVAGTLTADELVTHYVKLVHARTGSYLETARRVGLDRRTVKARVVA